MSRTYINGTEEILAGSTPWAAMVAGAIVPTASLVDGANFLKKDGSVSLTAALNFGGFTPTNSGTPVNASDVATKSYVDQKAGGIGGIHEVKLISLSNIAALSGAATNIDGIVPVAGDVVLLASQTTASQNGPWVIAAGAWSRPTWWAAASSVNEGQYFIIAPDGTTYKNTKWFCNTVGTITVDTTSVAFVQDASGTTYTNGAGLGLAGGTFSVIYGTATNTAAQGNDGRITGALQTSGLGTGVQTALGISVGSTGAPVVNGGALGTPSSGSLANASGLPATGLTGTLAAAQFPALTGDVTTTAGALGATVNNASGSGFIKYTNFVASETPGGLMNAANTSFSLANTPASIFGGLSSLELFFNGRLQESGSGNDYTISGSTITMLFAPLSTDKLRAFYAK